MRQPLGIDRNDRRGREYRAALVSILVVVTN